MPNHGELGNHRLGLAGVRKYLKVVQSGATRNSGGQTQLTSAASS